MVALVLLVVVGFASVYMGVFRRVSIDEREVGPFTLIYREVPGTSMKRARQVTGDLVAVLEARGVANRVPLDVFHPDDRQSESGFAVEAAASRLVAVAESGVQIKEMPRQRSLVTEFPWRNPLSFVVGYLKVDPALARYRARHGYVKTEALALNDGSTIRYIQPVREADVTSSGER